MNRRLRIAVAAVFAVLLAAGVMVAAGDPAPAVAECTGAAAIDAGCLERRYVGLAETAGAAAALRELGGRMKDDGYLRAACHQLAHRIGRTAGAKSGIAAFAQGDPVCSSGFYHGVTEAAMTKRGARGSVSDAPSVCAEVRKRPTDHETCIHGMGHGFMGVLGRDLGASLRGCDGLRDSRERRGCYDGVFMENLAAVDAPERGALRPDEPLYPCTAVATRYRDECYGRQSTYALFVNNGDFATVFALCAKTERAFRGACARGLGGDVAAETKEVVGRTEQARTRRRLCLLGAGSDARSSCVTGAVRVILQDLDGGPAQLDAFCGSLEAVATQPQHAACLRESERAYRELLAQQTGPRLDQGARTAGLDFICHLKKPGARRSNEGE